MKKNFNSLSLYLTIIFISCYNFLSIELYALVDLKKGKAIYTTVCITCHHQDPNKNGSLGPALIGTPLEVFMTKVPEGKYPEKYTPKRKTKLMKLFPQYKNDVESIYAYIQTLKKN